MYTNIYHQGGLIIADEMPGAYDELGNKRKEPPFSSKDVVVVGSNFNDLDKSQRSAMRELLLR